MKLIPKNWAKFQHYATRRPPWIKLHRGLLDDYDFYCLPVASKALAPMLWLLASEQQSGCIELDSTRLAFRVRMTEKELIEALKPLIDNGFFEDASNTLAAGEQAATSETETETDSDIAKAISGADAPSGNESRKTPDPRKQLFDLGKSLLGPKAGGLISAACARVGEPDVFRVIGEMTSRPTADPKAYFVAATTPAERGFEC